MALTIRRFGNLIEISDGVTGPAPREVIEALAPLLSYTHRQYLHPSERRELGTDETVRITQRRLFDIDARGRLCTCAGFFRKIIRALKDLGASPLYEDKSPAPRPGVEEVDMAAVTARFAFRPYQQEALEAIFTHRSGVIQAPTGFGKMALEAMVCLGLPNARIAVVTDRTAVVENTVSYLSKFLRVGQVGAGVNKPHERVTVYTADSLHKADASSVDVLLADEAHELMSDGAAERLQRFRFSRNYAFTASPEGRFDGADIRMEAIFGEKIFKISYQQAVDAGLLVPIRVEWVSVEEGPHGPPPSHDTERKRRLLWSNEHRNRKIAEACQTFKDEQVLVLVDFVEHAARLGALLPGYQLVYGDKESSSAEKMRAMGLLPEKGCMTRSSRKAMREAFSSGELRKVIATGVWAVGVDFPQLQVLVRADAGNSEISSIQMPGRVSRISKETGKQVGSLIDFRDEFDRTLRERAGSRHAHYRKLGWEQVAFSRSSTS